jgi:chromate transporter
VKKRIHDYMKLFSSTFYLSAFTFGGGYVIITLMKKKFVDVLKWIGEDEMLNMTAIAQSSPGPVAVNTSILLGYRVAGVFGAVVALFGTILPPFFVISAISFFYSAFRENIVVNAVMKGMQAGIAAVIADVVLNLGGGILKKKDIISMLVMTGAFIMTFFLKVRVIYIILVCGAIGAARVMLQKQNTEKDGDAI